MNLDGCQLLVHEIRDGCSFNDDVSALDDNSLTTSTELALVKPYVEEAPVEKLCGDKVLVRAISSIGHIDSTCTKSLDLAPISSPLHPAPLFYLLVIHGSLGDIRGCHPPFDPCCAWSCLEKSYGIPFDHAFAISMAFDSLGGY